MRRKYHKQIVDMLDEEWDLGKRTTKCKTKACAWYYWNLILSESEKIIIEKDDDKVIGVCGYSKWGSKKHWFRKTWYKIKNLFTVLSPSIKNKKAIKVYNKTYNYLPKELENYFDGEMSILIVDKNYRNKHIGSKLVRQIFDYAKKDNMKNLQILSDESCNYKFYENLGCKKIYETTIQNGEKEYTEEGFIYEKKFK